MSLNDVCDVVRYIWQSIIQSSFIRTFCSAHYWVSLFDGQWANDAIRCPSKPNAIPARGLIVRYRWS